MADDAVQTAAPQAAAPQDPATEKTRRGPKFSERTRCRFCRDAAKRIDYKDVTTLQEFCRGQGKIVSRKRSRTCAQHQRLVKKAIKQARYIALLSYTENQARR